MKITVEIEVNTEALEDFHADLVALETELNTLIQSAADTSTAAKAGKLTRGLVGIVDRAKAAISRADTGDNINDMLTHYVNQSVNQGVMQELNQQLVYWKQKIKALDQRANREQGQTFMGESGLLITRRELEKTALRPQVERIRADAMAAGKAALLTALGIESDEPAPV